MAAMANVRGKRKKPALTPGAEPESTVRREDALVTIVSPETATAIEAFLVGGKGWRRRTRRPPSFGDEHETYVTMGEPGEDLQGADEERAWKQVLALDDETALAFVYAAARYLAINKDPNTVRPATIHVNEFLEYQGHTRQTRGDFKTTAKHEVRRRFAALARVYVVRRIGRARRNPTFETSQLVTVTTRSQGSDGSAPLPYLEEPTIGVPYEFDVQLGSWAKTYVERDERHTMLASILRYEPSKRVERIAMRLGLYLHFKPSRITSVAGLLDGAHIERPTHHFEKFRDDFEAALDRLQSDRIIGRWAYSKDTELPIRSWFERWLEWELTISEGATLLKG